MCPQVWQRTAVLQQEGGRAVSVCGARLPQSVPAVLLATPHAVHYKPKDSHVAVRCVNLLSITPA